MGGGREGKVVGWEGKVGRRQGGGEERGGLSGREKERGKGGREGERGEKWGGRGADRRGVAGL